MSKQGQRETILRSVHALPPLLNLKILIGSGITNNGRDDAWRRLKGPMTL